MPAFIEEPDREALLLRHAIEGVPTFLVLDADGTEIDRLPGTQSVASLRRALGRVWCGPCRSHDSGYADSGGARQGGPGRGVPMPDPAAVRPSVLMLPGFGGGADQPVLVALENALRPHALLAVRASLPRGRPSPGLVEEVSTARTWVRADPDIAAYAGRSFGGRVLARLALEKPPRALVLLGFPVRSASGQRRLEDERVLAALACPTLVLQGSADPLGPIRTLERLATRNPRLELAVLDGATHAFGRREPEAVRTAADWLAARVLTLSS